MTAFKRLFCNHPASVNETYVEHLLFAIGFGLRMLVGGLACILHGFLPFLCVCTGSQSICDLHDRLQNNGRPHNEAFKQDHVAQN